MAAPGFMRVYGRRSARRLWQRNARHQCADGSLYLRADCSPHLHAHRPWRICGNTTTHSGAYNHFTT